MTSMLQRGSADLRAAPLPRNLAALMRPELPSLVDEIIAEICATIPEYARPLEGPYGWNVRTSVQNALDFFVDLVADPRAPRNDLARVCRRMGRYQALEGQNLDSLQAAYRVGVRVAWHRAMDLGRRAELSSEVMSQLAEAAFGYIDELAVHTRDGYLEQLGRSAEIKDKWRRRLLAMVLESPAAPPRAVAELAERTAWEVPAEVTMVAVQPGPGLDAAPPEGDLLADLADVQPHLLVPGPLTAGRRAEVVSLLGRRRAAAGLTVPLTSAADSLRWARKALALAQAGVISGRLPSCDDHLVTLWLMADVPLAEQVARRKLAGLADLTPLRQRQLTDTLAALLETGGTATQAAARLGVHPQTVRYRIRQLEQILGDALADPDGRFALELAVRALRVREAASRHGDALDASQPA